MIGCMLLISLFCNADISASEQPIRIDTILLSPFGFLNEDGKRTGFFYDIGSQIAKEAGFSYENSIVPFARMVHNLKNGNSDFSIFLRSKENDKIAVPIAPVFSLTNIIVGLKGTKFDSLQSLYGKTVARVRGARYDKLFDNNTAIKIIDTGDYSESIRILVHKRIDAVIITKMGFLFTLQQLGYSKGDFSDPFILNTKDAWVQFSKTTADDTKIAALKEATERILKGDTIQNLFNKYAGE
jgi:polar amino acid transport system substrate-binding protein